MDEHSIQFKNEPITEKWIAGVPIVGAWVNNGSLFNCNTTPLINGSFTHIKICSQKQNQNIKTPETSTITNEVRYSEIIKEQTIAITENLTEQWVLGIPVLSTWIDKDDLFDCSLLPSVADQSIGVSFNQTKTCSQKQEQTVRTPETSSLTNEIRYVDTLNEQVKSIVSTQNAIGERYTNIIKVGYYTLSGVHHYRGYLNPNYTSYPDYNNYVQINPSSLTPNKIAGLDMRWVLALTDGSLIFTTSNAAVNNNLAAYSVTMNGVTCSLKWQAYQENFMTGTGCFNLNNVVGQEIKMDIRLK
jgi:hypothetical protein